MRGVVCKAFGDEDMLVIEEVDSGECLPNQIRINVKAAALNFPDTLIIRGLYQFKPELPFIPGHEVSGVVTETGKDIMAFKPGDRVMSIPGMGAFAEEVLVTPESQQVHKIPDEMPWDHAAAMNFTYGTSIHALRQRAGLKSGESVLILGASGGCGSAAVELATAMGAMVIAAAGSDDKCKMALNIGADHAINYSKEGFSKKVKELTNGKGVNVVFDPVGGDIFRETLRCLAWYGRLVVIGFSGGGIPVLKINQTILKCISVIGVNYGLSVLHDPKMNEDNVKDLFDYYKTGKIKPVISECYPLEKVPQALKKLGARQATGKVVIEI